MKVDRKAWERNPREVPTLAPFPATKTQFIDSALNGRMTPEDQAYMARALLQLSDEAAEMRERIRALEMAVKALVAKSETPPD